MSNRVLVTYATFTGSTAGVAEAIGQTLSEHGLDAEVHPMHEVTDLTPYDAVVAGSAIQAKAWLPEAMQFIEKNRAALAAKPFAAFLVCSTLALRRALCGALSQSGRSAPLCLRPRDADAPME